MSAQTNVAILVGSLRKESFSRKIAKALIKHAPERLSFRLIEIGDLPLYNEDLDAEPPASWVRFRTEIKSSSAILFVTPEYNRSIPACLKNALDVGSRPQGESVFDGVPAGVVSVTPYQMGAFGANHALRQTFVFLNMPVMQQPEAYIGKVTELFDKRGNITNAETAAFLETFMAAFASWISTVEGGQALDFSAFMEERSRVSNAYIEGDAAALHPILTEHNPATFFGPDGGTSSGSVAVRQSYDKGAAAFDRGSAGHLDVLQQAAGGDLAFWTGYQRAEVRMKGKPDPVSMVLRTTEIFRREAGGWKLFHRHADFGEKATAG